MFSKLHIKCHFSEIAIKIHVIAFICCNNALHDIVTIQLQSYYYVKLTILCNSIMIIILKIGYIDVNRSYIY